MLTDRTDTALPHLATVALTEESDMPNIDPDYPFLSNKTYCDVCINEELTKYNTKTSKKRYVISRMFLIDKLENRTRRVPCNPTIFEPFTM